MLEYNNELFKEKFNTAIEILKTFENNNFKAYFVGGCVRDYILKKEFSDIDITTNALPEEIKTIFNRTIDTGIKHGTVTIFHKGNYYEVTTFRTELDYTNHRSPDKVEFVGSLEKDLERRDFTINAMALDSRGRLYDFHNGLSDLNYKIIKTVNSPNERFNEDALRMLRAFRFSSKLEFKIEDETYNAIVKNRELIKFVSIERVVVEFKKLLHEKGNKNALEQLINSKIGCYIPFIKFVKEYTDFANFTFSQALYWLMYFNNIELLELKKLKLSNNEINKIKKYKKIKLEFDKKTPIEVIIYDFGKEDVKFIVDIFKIMSIEKLNDISLPILNFSEIEITTKEIIKIINKKPGSWIKEVNRLIEVNILLNNLQNSNKEIIDFLLKLKDKI